MHASVSLDTVVEHGSDIFDVLNRIESAIDVTNWRKAIDLADFKATRELLILAELGISLRGGEVGKPPKSRGTACGREEEIAGSPEYELLNILIHVHQFRTYLFDRISGMVAGTIPRNSDLYTVY
jgi:hypothetical protein